MKKLLITLLKVSVSVGILAYMVWDTTRGHPGPGQENINAFANLRDQPKDYLLLAGAWACCTAAVVLTFVRWWYLVRALDVPLRFRDAMRISFWGYLFNLAPLGIVGGDVVKVVMLAHEQPQHRAKALASVLFDRVVGLYLLFVVASSAILATGFWRIDVVEIRGVCNATFVVTIVGALGLAVVLGPDVITGGLIRAFGQIPRVGPPLESVMNAVRMYARKPFVLIFSSVMSIGVHCLFAVGCYLIARGLPGEVLSLGMHFVVMPLSCAAGVLPLPMGPFEWVLDSLYTTVPAGVTIIKGQGFVVALAYRVITLLIAALGLPYYFGNRREMAEVMHEAEEQPA